MRTVRSVLATLSVLAVAALPAVAQEGGNTDEMDAALARLAYSDYCPEGCNLG